MAVVPREMISGWAVFDLGWSKLTFCVVGGFIGALSGTLMTGRNWRLGGIAGVVAMVGALLAGPLYLEPRFQVWNYSLAIIPLAGSLPGVFLYFVARAIYDRSKDTKT